MPNSKPSTATEGPGEDAVPIWLTLFGGALLLFLTVAVLYSLVKIWPHPTPSGKAPIGATTESPPKSPVDTSAAPAETAEPKPPAPDTTRPSAASRSSLPTADGHPLALDDLPPALICDSLVRRTWTPADTLKDPSCISLFTYEFPIWAEQRLLLIVLLAGSLGGLLHAMRSYFWYVGNRNLRRSWLLMYLFLPFVGSIIACLFYFVIRGGFFSPTSHFEETSPAGFAAFAALVGLFSQQAILKLRHVANTLLTSPAEGKDATPQGEDDDTGGKASGSTKPAITAIAPASVSLSAAGDFFDLDIQGTGFVADSKVKIEGVVVVPTTSTATQLNLRLDPVDVPRRGELKVTVVNPAALGGESEPAILTVT